MNSPSIPPRRRLRRFLKRLFSPGLAPAQTAYDEILFLSSRTQSLEELLAVLPERVCAALELSSFHVFLRERSDYVLQRRPGAKEPRLALAASCSTVSRMKRDRRPAFFVTGDAPDARPDGWQLLATPFEIEVLTSLGTHVLLPLEGRTGLMGFLTLARAARPTFTPSEQRFLKDLGPQMGRGLETAQLVKTLSEQAVARARAHRELELAREVQERLLPLNVPRVPGIDAAAAYRSAEQIGGDYYDLFTTNDGLLCTVIADVSGKGIPAALLMASLSATLHALFEQQNAPLTATVERLNALMYGASSASRYATFFCCVYDPPSRKLTYVNAGHNPPFLLHSNRTLRRLECGGPVVGLLPGVSFESETLTLDPGDTLIAYTDGVSEATDPRGAEWADTGIEAAILRAAALPGLSSAQIVKSLLAQLDSFAAGTPPNDDLTLVVLHSTATA